MSHFEGPVVDSFYEIALQSWYNQLSPLLPCLDKPYQPPRDAQGNVKYLFADENPFFDDVEIVKAARAARLLLRKQTQETHDDSQKERFRDAVKKVVDQQRQSLANWAPGEELELRAQQAMRDLREFRDKWMNTSRPGSRANSRAPSRRTSMVDGITLERGWIGDCADVEQRGSLELGRVSESPSSPTVIGDTPRAKDRPHVNFADRVIDKDVANEQAPTRAMNETSPTNAQGEPLPPSALLPSEVVDGSTEKIAEDAPPGTGSRRMFQLSKRFSEYPFTPS